MAENGGRCRKSTEIGIQYISGLIAGQKTERLIKFLKNFKTEILLKYAQK